MGSMPDWPGYVVRMIREVIEDFLVPDVGDDGARRVASVGGEAAPAADLLSWMGSRLGESLLLGLGPGAGLSWLIEFDVSTLLWRASTLTARFAWSVWIVFRVERISDRTSSVVIPLVGCDAAMVKTKDQQISGDTSTDRDIYTMTNSAQVSNSRPFLCIYADEYQGSTMLVRPALTLP
jgi:hypothetical protein